MPKMGLATTNFWVCNIGPPNRVAGKLGGNNTVAEEGQEKKREGEVEQEAAAAAAMTTTVGMMTKKLFASGSQARPVNAEKLRA